MNNVCVCAVAVVVDVCVLCLIVLLVVGASGELAIINRVSVCWRGARTINGSPKIDR